MSASAPRVLKLKNSLRKEPELRKEDGRCGRAGEILTMLSLFFVENDTKNLLTGLSV